MSVNPVTLPLSDYTPRHVRLEIEGSVATIILDRPERKNPLTFESYAELVGIFRAAGDDPHVKVFVLTGAGGNFSSGGDVHEIIAPLIEMDTVGLMKFTKMTGELVKAMRACPQPIVAAIDGICAGAGCHHGDGVRHQDRHAGGEGRISVQPRRPRRLRHGRLRHTPPHRRTGARLRTSLYRPSNEKRRGRALGIL